MFSVSCLTCIRVCVLSHSVVSNSLQPFELQPTRFLCLWNSQARILELVAIFLLQGIFQTQVSNLHLLCLLHCRQILYRLSHHRSLIYMKNERKKVKSLNRAGPFSTPWTVACWVPLSMGFSRQEYWSGLPFPSPVNLSVPGIEPESPTLQADSLPSEPPENP